MGSHYVDQAGIELLASSDPSASASESAGIEGHESLCLAISKTLDLFWLTANAPDSSTCLCAPGKQDLVLPSLYPGHAAQSEQPATAKRTDEQGSVGSLHTGQRKAPYSFGPLSLHGVNDYLKDNCDMRLLDGLGSEMLFLLSNNVASLRQAPCDQEEQARNAILCAAAPQRKHSCHTTFSSSLTTLKLLKGRADLLLILVLLVLPQSQTQSGCPGYNEEMGANTGEVLGATSGTVSAPEVPAATAHTAAACYTGLDCAGNKKHVRLNSEFLSHPQHKAEDRVAAQSMLAEDG
ncbi:hypothetical protein AAY473_022912 [Plecturocebus cupreus]